jgi:hypothetical protein
MFGDFDPRSLLLRKLWMFGAGQALYPMADEIALAVANEVCRADRKLGRFQRNDGVPASQR